MGAGAIIGGLGLASSIGGQIAGAVSANKQAELDREAIHRASRQDVVATEFEIGEIREQARQVTGAQIAGYGRSGVVLEGSPLRKLVETSQKAEEDVFWQRYNLKHRIKMRTLQGAGTDPQNVGRGFGMAGSLLSGISQIGAFGAPTNAIPGVSSLYTPSRSANRPYGSPGSY